MQIAEMIFQTRSRVVK
ncbi:DUF6783 domain-containing protein [Anaerobutyricum hallii]